MQEPTPHKLGLDPANESPFKGKTGLRRVWNALSYSLAGLKAAKFKEAAASYVAFIKTYPNSSLAASAHYWGAYASAQAKDHAGAAELFGKFAAGWPKDERAPTALESRVASLEAIKDVKGARVTLDLLAENYPNSEAGKKAKLRLKKK